MLYFGLLVEPSAFFMAVARNTLMKAARNSGVIRLSLPFCCSFVG